MLARAPNTTEEGMDPNEDDDGFILSIVLVKSFNVIGEKEVNDEDH